MKKFFFVFAAAAVTMISCSKVDNLKDNEAQSLTEPNPELVEMSFSASSVFSRAHLESDRSVTFSAGDEIAVFANGTKYRFSTTDGGANAVFTGEAEQADTYYALFPYSDGAGFDTSTNTITGVTLASGSTMGGASNPAGSFHSQRPVFVAKTNGNHLLFKSAVALLKITVPSNVTDLKSINFFVRNKETAACIIGTASITPTDDSSNDAPTVKVTAAPSNDNFVALYGTGSSGIIGEGDYYLPVFPATYSDGFDLKLTFADDLVGRAGNGAAFDFVQGKVYNLGTVKKMAGFVYSSFESGMLSDTITGGNETAVSVIANPVKDDRNNSNYVFAVDMHTRDAGNATSGIVKFNPVQKAKFPSSSSYRGFFKGVSVKFYSAHVYVPHFTVSGKSSHVHPTRVNGTTITSEEDYIAAFQTNYWNVLEWDHSTISDVSSFSATCSSLDFRFFANWNNSGVSRPDYDLICYVDDVSFYNDAENYYTYLFQ